uniref:NADH-ubiquinone oxidoreductase chain 4L n=1 Tax=Agrilus biguttatus TaxID=324823 RepID=A0A0S2MQ24_9COLE|nr:NADH deshydrogenase subunit 4L [Agrilus biguttatus]
MLIFNFSIFTSLLGLLIFCSQCKHMLLTLLSLEFIVLSIYFMSSVFLMFLSYEFFFLMIFLTFSVCEGALGLSILVSLIRTHGNDYFQSFNILW